ncbi:357_t:CDS:2 [Dentiscutata erythropus]|uniref:357_t:CDS:1 n=1 Tax=Dentiscutata erythropus TaxID=1348616 RepID=A0A9N9P3J7_9GLOM|nr:357_t:CDS:2 [Dentiscutata erythropus]
MLGNRENVKPDYLASSIDMSDNDKDLAVSSHKKRKISEIDQIYFDELRSLRKTKKIGLEIAQERLKIENQKFLNEDGTDGERISI